MGMLYVLLQNVLWKMRPMRTAPRHRWSATAASARVETGSAPPWPVMVSLNHQIIFFLPS